jgi:hypothetical protein
VRVERQIRAIIEAIKDGLRTPSMKDELVALEARKQQLTAKLKQAPAPAPRLRPKLADLYRQRVERLHQELNRPELRSEAAQALRGLIDQVRPRKGGSRSIWSAIWPASLRLVQAPNSPPRETVTGRK